MMIILSLNMRGIGGTLKQQALKRMFFVYKPDVVMIQESMRSRSKSIEIFSSISKGWKSCSIDAEGLSKGLVTGWNANFDALSTHTLDEGYIILEDKIEELGKVFKLVNLYGPYGDRKPY